VMAGRPGGAVSAEGDFSGFVMAEEGNVRSVTAGGQFTGHVRATGNVSRVQAERIADAHIVAGDMGARGRDVGAVVAGDGGIQDTDIRATRHVKAVTAGVGGIQGTQVRAGVYDQDDPHQVYAGSVFCVYTDGSMQDTLIIAGVDPGPDGQYGKHPNAPAEATDNLVHTSAKVRHVEALLQYGGDVRIVAGSRTLGQYLFNSTARTVSEATPDPVNGPNFLTLIRTVNGVSTVIA